MSSYDIQSLHVTNAARPPQLSLGHPQVKNSDPGRKTGANKFSIPLGPLAKYIPKHFRPSGVIRAALDQIRINSITAELAHEGESTTFDQQVKVDGRRLIKSTTTASTLDSIAADLITRIYGLEAPVTEDAILTRFGFRTEFTADSVGFVERLVALQLIVRRGMELRQTLPEGDLPNFLWSNPQSYNENDWDATLSTAEGVGVSTPQPKSQRSQIEALEAIQEDSTTATPKGSDNQEMLNQTLQALNAHRESINAKLDAQNARITALQEQKDERPRKQRRLQEDIQPGEIQGSQPPPITPTRPSPLSFTVPSGSANSTDYAAVRRQQPMHPSASATSDRQPEIESKLREGKRVTADTVFALISNDDQADIIVPITDSAGGIAFKSSTQSTRKITTIGELDKVTNVVMRTMSAINEDIAYDLRHDFVNTISRAHQFFKEDIALTIAYWNKHFNAYHLGIKHSAVRTKLTFVREFAEDIRDEIQASRQVTKQTQQQRSQLKDFNKALRKMQDAGGHAGKAPVEKRDPVGGPRIVQKVTPAMQAQECYNWKAGSPCVILDAHRNCVFKHVGERGAEPNAAFERWNKKNQ